MRWRRSQAAAPGADQLAIAQTLQCSLNRALGQAGRIGNLPETGGNRFPVLLLGNAVKPEKDEKRGWMMVVCDQVAHQNIDDVIINRNGSTESGHDLGGDVGS